MEFKKTDIFTVPNILTYLRIAAVPFFVWLMADVAITNRVYFALGLFLLAESTDLVDGWFARKFNQVSDIGKILDPVADKILQIAAVVCLAVFDPILWVFAGLVLVKEGIQLAGGLIVLKASGRKVEIMANMWGKTASVAFTAGYLFAFLAAGLEMTEIRYTSYAILSVASIIAILALVFYSKDAVTQTIQVRKEDKEEQNG